MRRHRYLPILLVFLLAWVILTACAKPYGAIKLQADGMAGLKDKTVSLVVIKPEYLNHAELYVYSPSFRTARQYTKDELPGSASSPRLRAQIFPWGALLDLVVIRKTMGSLMSRLDKIDTQLYLDKWFTAVFRPALEDQGLRVVSTVSRDAEKLKRLPESPGGPRFDLSTVSTEPVDYVLVLEVLAFGAGRSYTVNGVPVSPAWGESAVAGYFVEAKANHWLWQDMEVIRQGASGDWDEPSEYPTLTRAVLASLERSINQMFFSLFGRAP
jgi:hypothetical protein